MQAHVKEEIALGPHTAYRGYQQLGANVTRYEGGFQRDWHEAIDLYREEAERVKILTRSLKHQTTCVPVSMAAFSRFCIRPRLPM